MIFSAAFLRSVRWARAGDTTAAAKVGRRIAWASTKDSGPDHAALHAKKKPEPNTRSKFEATRVARNFMRQGESEAAASRGGSAPHWRMRHNFVRDRPRHFCAVVLRCFPLPITGTSAAQNVQVINTCSKCGAILFEDASRCSFCDAPLTDAARPDEFAAVAANDVEPDWRLEVAQRLELYRARRRRLHAGRDAIAAAFPRRVGAEPRRRIFRSGCRRGTRSAAETGAQGCSASRSGARGDFDIAAGIRFFSFGRRTRASANGADRRGGFAGAPQCRSAGRSLPHAGVRRLFGAVSFARRAFAFARVDAVVYMARRSCCSTRSISRFSRSSAAPRRECSFAGYTWCVSTAHLAENRQLLWRGFAYLLSAGALMLGFLWALVGRRPLHLARPHFAHLRHVGGAARPGGVVRGRPEQFAANLGAQVASHHRRAWDARQECYT